MVIKVLHIGLGSIGAAVVRQAAARKRLRIVGAVDVDPGKVGRDLGAVCGMRRRLGVVVTDDIAKAIKSSKPDIAVLSTGVSLKNTLQHVEQILKLKVPIVSTAPELAYPVHGNRATAKKIDALARRARVAVLGTGGTPGWATGALPIALSSVCAQVDAIEVIRVDVAPPDGAPLGLAESVAMIADAMGWKLDANEHGVGSSKGKVRIRLRQDVDAAAAEPTTTIRIMGVPPVTATIAGVQRDLATAAITVNAIPNVLTAQPGLRTLKDIAQPSYFSG